MSLTITTNILVLQALRASNCLVADIDAAQLIYVDLYCPYITWLGIVHHADIPEELMETPGDDILKVSLLIRELLSRMAMSQLNAGCYT